MTAKQMMKTKTTQIFENLSSPFEVSIVYQLREIVNCIRVELEFSTDQYGTQMQKL